MRRHLVSLIAVVVLGSAVAWAGNEGPLPVADTGPADPTDEGRIIVKFADDARVRLRAEGLVSLAGAELAGVKDALASFGTPHIERLFRRDESRVDRNVERASLRSGRALPDLNGYFELVVAPDEVDAVIGVLEKLDEVQTAYRAPLPVPPPTDIPPTTPDFEPQQGHLDEAPGGVDARAAWTFPGGRGEGIFVIDVEYDWNEDHEDLENIQGRELCFTPNGNFTDHGTAVMGEIGGTENGYGITGIAPGATYGMVTQDPVGMSNSVARAIECATSLLDPGDVILMETQTSGPQGLAPSEWNQAEFDAISVATAAGIVVVEAAGNGGNDLDDPVYNGRFDITVRDSGAIIVGAGAPPGASQAARSRLSFSNHGSRVDVQAWGQSVVTTGYGSLFNGGGDFDQEYTDGFNGTSSASGLMAGTVTALQGVQKARTGVPFEPTVIRQLLKDTGTPQQSGPYSGNIGPLPDLAAAIQSLVDLAVTDVAVDDLPPLGDASGSLDPGETATLRLTVGNFASEPATNLYGLLRAQDPDVVVTEAQADWPDVPSAGSAESLPIHHRITVGPQVQCGSILRFDVALTSDSLEDDSVFDLRLGGASTAGYANAVPTGIPDDDPVGVSSITAVPIEAFISDAEVNVDIRHNDIGELRVVLQSPAGTSVMLHDHTQPGRVDLVTNYDTQTLPDGPGSMNDFNGESILGDWTLTVVDDQGTQMPGGTLKEWSLDFTTWACQALDCGDPVPGAMDDSLRMDKSGSEGLRFAWQADAGAASYRVWRSDDVAFEDDLLIGQSAALEWIQSDGQSDPAALVFYQVRAVNSCEWEGP